MKSDNDFTQILQGIKCLTVHKHLVKTSDWLYLREGWMLLLRALFFFSLFFLALFACIVCLIFGFCFNILLFWPIAGRSRPNLTGFSRSWSTMHPPCLTACYGLQSACCSHRWHTAFTSILNDLRLRKDEVTFTSLQACILPVVLYWR